MDQTAEELFDVWLFYPNGTHTKEAADVPIEAAITKASQITRRPAVMLGIIDRVMITNKGDLCVFDWNVRQGVVFPTREASE